ncbi:hypothetical protein BJY00DRAFT_316708 [Aspergillus carlsbadensis]|nr:hypothetical protein BJY00DRAFT_316708 [Aspergillus carlsbadensis]
MATETIKSFNRTQNALEELHKAFDACPHSLHERYNRNHLANHAFRWARVKRDVLVVAGYFEGDVVGSLRFLHTFLEDVEWYARQCLERTVQFTAGADAEARVTKEDMTFVGDCGQAIQATLKRLEVVVSVYRDRDEMRSRIVSASKIKP